MRILKLVLSIALPPVGVYMTSGMSNALLINILLTLLGWLPGAIHGLWIWSKNDGVDQSHHPV